MSRIRDTIDNRVENGLETHSLLRSIRVAVLRSRPWYHRYCSSIVFVQKLTLQMATYEENVLRKVLLDIEHDDKFSLGTPRAILARQAAKFILDAERSIVDSFCQKLTDAIQNIIDRVKAANYKSFGTTQERLWGRFSGVRSSALMVLWNELWLSLGDGTFCKDPLLMQHCNTRAFELAIKLNFPMPGPVILTTSLTNDEENALRYAAGFVIRCTSRKISTTCHPFKTQMLTILEEMKEDDSKEVTYLAYTKVWIDKINRGGLLFIDDETFLLFLAIEYATRSSLSVLLGLNPPHNLDEDVAAKAIIDDPDVQFHWQHLTSNHEETVTKELQNKLVSQWITIRGFSMAAAVMEDYKHAQCIHLKAKKALRKELHRQTMENKSP